MTITFARARRADHWKAAFPCYGKVALIQSAIFWAPPFAIALLQILWIGVTQRRFVVNWLIVEYGLVFGGFFFALTFLTAIADDLIRNRQTEEPTIEWNPALTWKVFISIGALGSAAAAYFAYPQGWHLSAFFAAMAVGCVVAVRKCF